MNLPNTLTLLRIILVPVVVWLIGSGRTQVAFWCFLAAGVSDAIDGYLARRLNQRTQLGAYLDPLADKALLVSIYVTLGVIGLMPNWLPILVVARDVMIVGAIILSWVMEHPVTIAPLFISKMNTAAQIALAAAVLAASGFSLDLDPAIVIGTILVAALTSLSMAAYLITWIRHMTREDRKPDSTDGT